MYVIPTRRKRRKEKKKVKVEFGITKTSDHTTPSNRLIALHGRECLKEWKNKVSVAVAAGGLGPVRKFFEEGPVLNRAAHGEQFYVVVPVKAVIKSLVRGSHGALLGK